MRLYFYNSFPFSRIFDDVPKHCINFKFVTIFFAFNFSLFSVSIWRSRFFLLTISYKEKTYLLLFPCFLGDYERAPITDIEIIEI